MAIRQKGIRSLAVAAGLLAAVLIKSCGGGGSSLMNISLPGNSPSAGNEAALTGRVLDPFVLLGCLSNPGAAFCGISTVAFGSGSPVQILNLSSQGDPLFPARGLTSLAADGRFVFAFEGSITDPVGQLVSVQSGGGGVLRGFVFSAAVEVSPWSEALYQIILRERNRGTIGWTNLTAAELRDLENILLTQVPLSRTARTLDELIADLIQEADRLRFGQLRFVEDLIRFCYAPEGNQSDQPCRVQIPVPLPPPISMPRPPILPTPTPESPDPGLAPLVLTNRAFVTVNGVTQSSNAVSITVLFP
ncbi:MAG: hypothetical protein Q6M04_01710 [Thermostichus sp. BF3_bins_97]